MSNVLVVGGTGLVGSHLVSQLIEHKDLNVFSVARTAHPNNKVNSITVDIAEPG